MRLWPSPSRPVLNARQIARRSFSSGKQEGSRTTRTAVSPDCLPASSSNPLLSRLLTPFFSLFSLSLFLSISPSLTSLTSATFDNNIAALQREAKLLITENVALAQKLASEAGRAAKAIEQLHMAMASMAKLAQLESKGPSLAYSLPARLSSLEVNLWASAWSFGQKGKGHARCNQLLLTPVYNLSTSQNLALSYEWLVTGKNVSDKLLQRTSSAAGPSPVAICADEAGRSLYTAHGDSSTR